MAHTFHNALMLAQIKGFIPALRYTMRVLYKKHAAYAYEGLAVLGLTMLYWAVIFGCVYAGTPS